MEKILEIPGDYLEGGGQILRTASALSCITKRPIRVFNIRANRKNPGLKPQHLYTLKTLAFLFQAETKGLELNSREITFYPTRDSITDTQVDVDLKTAGAIGLALQPLLLVSAFKSEGVIFNIKGGTCGLGAVPLEYYPGVIFPLLSYCGLNAQLEILRRGYYPKGGGQARVRIEPIREPKTISLYEAGRPVKIKIISIASDILASRRVAERQAENAQALIQDKLSLPVEIKTEYASTFSVGSEINILAYTKNNCILWADARGERSKPAEEVGKEAAAKLIKEINSGAAVDLHLADNLIPWLSLLGGRIKTSIVSLHAQTNIWICEQFLGKVFKVEGNVIQAIPAFSN